MAEWHFPNRNKTKRAPRRPSIAPLIKQATEAGVTVAGAIVRPDGSVALTFSQGTTVMSANPWDEVLSRDVN